jgi:hypothetical protein
MIIIFLSCSAPLQTRIEHSSASPWWRANVRHRKKRQAACDRKLASYLPLSQTIFLPGTRAPMIGTIALSDSSTFAHRDPGSTGIPLDS